MRIFAISHNNSKHTVYTCIRHLPRKNNVFFVYREMEVPLVAPFLRKTTVDKNFAFVDRTAKVFSLYVFPYTVMLLK